jgi:hypothetical protein
MIVTPDYINTYTHVVLEQPLKSDKYLREEYTRNGELWERVFSSNSSFHLCPFDGSFRDCKSCGLGGEEFDIAYCLSKQECIPISTLVNRIKLCQAAGLRVEMY